jgi:aspartate/methionine/tyrosine aminotransferase
VDMNKFYAQLYKKHRMVVTDGRFFQMARHFRIAGVSDPETLAKGLQRLDEALRDSLKRS